MQPVCHFFPLQNNPCENWRIVLSTRLAYDPLDLIVRRQIVLGYVDAYGIVLLRGW